MAAPFVVFVNFFPHLNMQKTCWLWAPTTLSKNSSKSVIFSLLSESCFYCKKTPNLIIKLFLCFVSRPRVGPINSKHKFQMREHFCRHLHSSLISMRLSQGACPLLMDPRKYNADTVDLCRDDDARDYWCQRHKTSHLRYRRFRLGSKNSGPFKYSLVQCLRLRLAIMQHI
jgi:hypothetical protein